MTKILFGFIIYMLIAISILIMKHFKNMQNYWLNNRIGNVIAIILFFGLLYITGHIIFLIFPALNTIFTF